MWFVFDMDIFVYVLVIAWPPVVKAQFIPLLLLLSAVTKPNICKHDGDFFVSPQPLSQQYIGSNAGVWFLSYLNGQLLLAVQTFYWRKKCIFEHTACDHITLDGTRYSFFHVDHFHQIKLLLYLFRSHFI